MRTYLKNLFLFPLFLSFLFTCGLSDDAYSIPEPMFFDLIRPLGAKKGELEVNTLASFPSKTTNKKTKLDPFSPSATSKDNEKIEWAPEIEYALADGFAIEFELPFEGSELEAYKFGAQYTFGTLLDNSYIHGLHFLLEPTKEWEQYNTTAMYVGGYRLNKLFSTLFMLGGRADLEGDKRGESFEYLANISLFANISHSLVFGVETNYSKERDRGFYALKIIPQIQYELNEKIEFQAGWSFGEATHSREQSFVMRAIYCF